MTDVKPAVDIYDCRGGKFIVIWRKGQVEECRKNVFVNPGDMLSARMNHKVFHKDADGNILGEVEKPPIQDRAMGISGYQCSWCGRQIFWGTPEDPTNLEARAEEHRRTCPRRPELKGEAKTSPDPSTKQKAPQKKQAAKITDTKPQTEAPVAPVATPPVADTSVHPKKFKVVEDITEPPPKPAARTFKKFTPIPS
jgi:hypothetical protein